MMHGRLFGFAFLGSLLLALAGAQTRPKISEIFELNAVVEVQSKDSGHYIGESTSFSPFAPPQQSFLLSLFSSFVCCSSCLELASVNITRLRSPG
jgi:hypothetical protein